MGAGPRPRALLEPSRRSASRAAGAGGGQSEGGEAAAPAALPYMGRAGSSCVTALARGGSAGSRGRHGPDAPRRAPPWQPNSKHGAGRACAGRAGPGRPEGRGTGGAKWRPRPLSGNGTGDGARSRALGGVGSGGTGWDGAGGLPEPCPESCVKLPGDWGGGEGKGAPPPQGLVLVWGLLSASAPLKPLSNPKTPLKSL